MRNNLRTMKNEIPALSPLLVCAGITLLAVLAALAYWLNDRWKK